MAKSVAKAFVEERRKLGFPLIHDEQERQAVVAKYTKQAEELAKRNAKRAEKGEN